MLCHLECYNRRYPITDVYVVMFKTYAGAPPSGKSLVRLYRTLFIPPEFFSINFNSHSHTPSTFTGVKVPVRINKMQIWNFVYCAYKVNNEVFVPWFFMPTCWRPRGHNRRCSYIKKPNLFIHRWFPSAEGRTLFIFALRT